jgi:hypothetical protein
MTPAAVLSELRNRGKTSEKLKAISVLKAAFPTSRVRQ